MRIIVMFTMGEDDSQATPEVMNEVAYSIAEFVIAHAPDGREFVPEDIQVGFATAISPEEISP